VADEIHHPEGRIEHPSVRYERTDASVRWVVLTLVAALVVAVGIYFGLWQFWRQFESYQARVKRSPFPLAAAPSKELPPEPRLEQLDRLSGNERPNVFVRETAREEALNSFGPTREEGYVHIPVERAMALLENKLPARAEPPSGSANREDGLVDSGEPNSGRMFRGKPRWFER
jgi:hypothetical protein